MLRPKAGGFSLIEMMVTLTVAGILTAVAVPAASDWIANSRIRSVAETFQNGMRLAQAEAIRRSRPAVFALTAADPAVDATPSANGGRWFVRLLRRSGETTDDTLYLRGGTEGTASSVTVTGPALLCFNAFGQQISLTATATGLGVACTAAGATPTEFSFARTGTTRPLKVQVDLGGQVRLCDPKKSNSAPDGCK
jgi:type IV fimbrial biogenesis protein FimT